jgi:hypothetical protein
MESRPSSRPSPEVVLAVWEAEDGRCEACKRPMDKRAARVARIDDRGPRTVENLQLLCVDCKAHRPDLLARVRLAPAVADRILGSLGPDQAEPASRWLCSQLQRYGVLITAGKAERKYWLPGVASFQVVIQPDGSAMVATVERIAAQPQVRHQAQARTRGLPRPDRRPLAASV